MSAALPTIPAIPTASCWGPARAAIYFPGRRQFVGLFAHLGRGDDYVLDHIVFDPTNPATVYAAAWGLFDDNDGGVFRSDDGGADVEGVAWGARQVDPRPGHGAQRSQDTGDWRAGWSFSHSRRRANLGAHYPGEPPGDGEPLLVAELCVSVAIDPRNPDVIYAGTRHLPWKTTDGGANWHNLKEGILDDSDVFSIIVDPKTPSRVYASACSGIYTARTAQNSFIACRGFPIQRFAPGCCIRTRNVRRSSTPAPPADFGRRWTNGAEWKLVTSPDVIVNDVMIDPRHPERVLVATDLRGVLVSNDGFAHIPPRTGAFPIAWSVTVIADRKDPNRIFVGVVNDKELGRLVRL